MRLLGEHEAVVVTLNVLIKAIAELSDCLGVLLVPCIREPLEEEQREHVGLEVGRVDRTPQRVRCVPESRFEFLLRNGQDDRAPLSTAERVRIHVTSVTVWGQTPYASPSATRDKGVEGPESPAAVTIGGTGRGVSLVS